MPHHDNHIKNLDKKITDLSDALAHLGKGTDLKELLIIIRKPGYTSVAELALLETVLDSLHSHANAIQTLQTHLVAASKLVAVKETAS